MTRTTSAVDSKWARLAALCLAVALAVMFYSLWRDDVVALFGDLTEPQTDMASADGDPVLAACLATRIGDVDRMRADGLIGDAQYEAFRSRAVSLCVAQAAGR